MVLSLSDQSFDTAAPRPDTAGATVAAARALLPHLERGRRIDAATLRGVMKAAFGASDAAGTWDWKTSYDACEAATVLFLRKFGPALRRRAPSAATMLPLLERVAGLLPTHTRRSQESQALQQFSTPVPLGLAAATAAALGPQDLVLEPSAGTGLLAVLAEMAGAGLILNELAETRARILAGLFAAGVTRHDAAQIHDRLDPQLVPSVVLMNPPFSAVAHVERRVSDAALRHLSSAFARLAPNGRLVAITGASLSPDNPAWSAAFVRLQERGGRVLFSAAVAGAVYARHGTTFDTRLTVIDKAPAEDPSVLPVSRGLAPDVPTLLGWIASDLPPRLAVAVDWPGIVSAAAPAASKSLAHSAALPAPAAAPSGVDLAYDAVDWSPADGGHISDAIYEPYTLQSIRIPGARPHPTQLVQSAAMASVAPPKPSYRPTLPEDLVAKGLLSDAQLESVIYAGEAHSGHLAAAWTVDDTFDVVTAAPEAAEGAVRFRRGWFLGDGTGAGKGRQVAGIILDNWLKGRRRALWVSKSDKLLEDAQRDWSALGQERLLVQPLSRFRQGTPVQLAEGILFTTYATLRSEGREGRASRLRQILDWLGRDFHGVIVFDEAHALQNAAGGTGDRGDVAPSQQGRAGLRLQHALPDARVVYVSATGATAVQNLAYAQRLGLWGGDDFPFPRRADFVEAIEAGGVAAMEVLARDLKALGLYASRSLSYEGVEYELVEHSLTEAQVGIYDDYAGAFGIIHNHLDAALEAAGVTGAEGTRNGAAKSAARSAFESAKQRFFNHLITAMKVPTLIASIERDLADGHAAVIQLVSTGEALAERRLAEIPTDEWHDVRVDITPREYVLDYLAHSFPTQLYEAFSTDDGYVQSRPAVDADGQPMQCREAVARRDALIEHLASLPAVPGALDQLVQHFGTDTVAEVTGRSRRIVRRTGDDGVDRMAVENRAPSANLAEAQAFMDDVKRILVFSDAGGTGRSYHAELSARNRRLRVHYLLEPGWKADAAIQGLGRTNRTNQAQPPLFRPIATDVKAEKRFLSTIARRLDSLGAITRGQRQTGGQGLFRPEDNLESQYARDALRQLYLMLVGGRVEGCSLGQFEAATGLRLTDSNGIKDELPPINTFLNRLLALPIALQNTLFSVFEELVATRVQGAIANGTYDVGLETLQADSFVIGDRQAIYSHPGSGAETRLLTIRRKRRNRPLPLDAALAKQVDPRVAVLVNSRSGRAAVQLPDRGLLLDDGSVERRVRLLRPMEERCLAYDSLLGSHWEEADAAAFAAAWSAEIAALPEFTTDEIHIVTGLLLPIWRRFWSESSRVFRLQTDAGERIVGRRVSPAWAADALGGQAPAIAPEAAFAELLDGRIGLDLADGLQLRRVRVMGDHRIELLNFEPGHRERLKADGLFGEIAQWKFRMFVPADASGAAVLAKLLTRHPIAQRHSAV